MSLLDQNFIWDRQSDLVWTLSSVWLLIAFPERNPGARRKRVFPPLPRSFQLEPIVTLVDWQAPRSTITIKIHHRGQGGGDPTSNLPILRPQTTVFLSPETALATSSMRAPGSQAGECYADVNDGRWSTAAKG